MTREDGVLAMFDATNIEPVYQPIFDLRDGSVVGYEALARGRGTRPPRRSAVRRRPRAWARRRAGPRVPRGCAGGRGRRWSGAPFCLFVNADARALEDDAGRRAQGSRSSWRSPSAR